MFKIIMKKQNLVGIIAYSLLLIVTAALVIQIGAAPEQERAKVGFITTGGVEDFGWNAMTYQGVSEACEELEMELLVRARVAAFDGSCSRAVQELVNEGASVIILNSGDYVKEMEGLLGAYSEVMFYCASAGYESDNLTNYFARMYQVRYLSGIVAGMTTKTNKVGYVGAEKGVEVYRNINAFALGVRRVNPDAEIAVTMAGKKDDQEREEAAAKRLIKAGVDVLTHQTYGRPYVIEVAEEAGISSIGYYQKLESASDRQLTWVECDWTPLYKNLFQDRLRGLRGGTTDWMGIESGVAQLGEFSPLVSEAVKAEVEKAANEILEGRDVFTGRIYDNRGRLRCGEGEAISDNTLMYGMDWLAEGVKVYE